MLGLDSVHPFAVSAERKRVKHTKSIGAVCFSETSLARDSSGSRAAGCEDSGYVGGCHLHSRKPVHGGLDPRH